VKYYNENPEVAMAKAIELSEKAREYCKQRNDAQ
jgi:hypothetical protein